MARRARLVSASVRSADRNVKGKIDRDGVWLETLERNPGRFLPAAHRGPGRIGGVPVDLNRPMPEVLSELSKYPVSDTS